MVTFGNLKDFFAKQALNYLLVADAEPVIHEAKGGKSVSRVPAGGVAIALTPVAKASGGVFIARGKTLEDRQVLDKKGRIYLGDPKEGYILKRIFLSDKEVDYYYNGFSNQTLWPLCHAAFIRPEFRKDWFGVYKRVNYQFAKVIKEEIKGKAFVWLNDYQLALVPKFLGRPPKTIIAMFWHIPWPTWEIFRLLPFKKEILESLLNCDFIGFHRGYHVRNFLETIEREFEARIDEEKGHIYFNNNITTVKNLPMGVDADIVQSLAGKDQKSLISTELTRSLEKFKIILGVDRLDYTKGFKVRLQAFAKFLEDNRQFLGKVVYLGVIAPSRESISTYRELKKEIEILTAQINERYTRNSWRPIQLIYQTFPREEVIALYRRADLCLVTPLDDGMNLVSKEFVIAASLAESPGMIVLSQFAGSAIDLTAALIVNPYNIEEVAQAIKKGLVMGDKEKHERIKRMVATLEEKNVYQWALEFVSGAKVATEESRLR